jgi:hypothetical protein
MNRFTRLPVYLAVTGLVVAGAIAGTAAAASASTSATDGFGPSCSSTGDMPLCGALLMVNGPATVTISISSSPGLQTTFVAWNTACSEAPSYKKTSGNFSTTTPVIYNVSVHFPQNGECFLAAAGGLGVTGTVQLSLSQSPAKPDIVGYANLCVDDAGNSTGPRNKVETWACTGGAAQLWTFSHDQLIHNGMCLNDKSSGGSGSPVVLYSCNGASNELWTHNVHGEYVLKARNGTLCLDDPAYSTKNGTQLNVYTCQATANQSWTLP